PRWLWQARPIAASLGTLFVRSYEHGERVHLAMLSRGFTGSMPSLDDDPSQRRRPLLARSLLARSAVLAPACLSLAVAIAALCGVGT
ncbi:MAG TPA: CbiQ family ECF transporter T component, partial [Ilumatobacteraceae bacterium]|nr:CbiQ family ECF transporter T component [Ilumatobacteraceae bacterium]